MYTKSDNINIDIVRSLLTFCCYLNNVCSVTVRATLQPQSLLSLDRNNRLVLNILETSPTYTHY